MELSKRREAKRSSCNFDTIIIDDELLGRRSSRSANDRSQIRRRRNRFYFSCNYRSQTAAAAASASMLLLLFVAALMLPCSSARWLADTTTTLSSIDNDNSAELTTETSVPPLALPQLASTTTNQTAIGKEHDLSRQEENNEIFAVLEISPDAVKPKFEFESKTLLNGDLEETIRNSVKTEIEMEQNLGSAAILDVLKDIPETEVRQKIAEEILSIDYPQKNTKEHRFNLMAEESVAVKKAKTVSPAEHNNFVDNIREARNLNTDLEEHLNALPDIEDSDIDNIKENTKIDSSTLKSTELTSTEKSFDFEPSSSPDLSFLESSSPSLHQDEENIHEAKSLNTDLEEHLNALPDIEDSDIDNIKENTKIDSSTLKAIELTSTEKSMDFEPATSSSSPDLSFLDSLSPSLDLEGENIREARNLNTDLEEHLNALPDIEDSYIDNIKENTKIDSSTFKSTELTSTEKTFDFEPSSSPDLSFLESSSPSLDLEEENIREARNLNTDIEEHLNALPDTESTDIDNIKNNKEIESDSPKVTELTNTEKTLDLQPALSASSSDSSSSDSSSASSESNSIENSANVEVYNTDNTFENVGNEINTEITENQLDLSTSTLTNKIVVQIPEVFNSNSNSSNSNNSLSIVLDETLSATEPSILLDNDKLRNFIDLEATNDILNVDEVTIASEQNLHIVIKKQGVDLNESPIDTIGNGGLGIFTVTTASIVIKEDNAATQSGNTELPNEIETVEPAVYENDEEDVLELKLDLKQFSTVQPEVEKHIDIEPNDTSISIDLADHIVEETGSGDLDESEFHQKSQFQVDFTSEIPFTPVQTIEPVIDENDSGDLKDQKFALTSSSEVGKQADIESEVPLAPETEVMTITTVEPEQQTQINIDAASTAFVEDSDFAITLKGSRSVNTNYNALSNVDETAATLFETFPPRDAGQTFNDNLAAESSGGVGKALPKISFNNESTNRSGVIIVLCSGTAILFIVILVVIFLISFQRQHGTLDIEMQEQYCGKDNLDEEDAETFMKLLNVELPQATIVVDAEETDECL